MGLANSARANVVSGDLRASHSETRVSTCSPKSIPRMIERCWLAVSEGTLNLALGVTLRRRLTLVVQVLTFGHSDIHFCPAIM